MNRFNNYNYLQLPILKSQVSYAAIDDGPPLNEPLYEDLIEITQSLNEKLVPLLRLQIETGILHEGKSKAGDNEEKEKGLRLLSWQVNGDGDTVRCY